MLIQNNSDGSASPLIFPDKAAAEKFAEAGAVSSGFDERYSDDITTVSIIIDEIPI